MQTEREQNDPKLFRTAARFIASPTVGGRRYWSDEVGEDKAGLLRVAASSADMSMCRTVPLWKHDRKGRAGFFTLVAGAYSPVRTLKSISEGVQMARSIERALTLRIV
jgi:hypothetical protein